MAKFYGPNPERAPRTHSFKTLLVFVLLLTLVDFATTLLLTIPCIRSLYARQNNVDYTIYRLETEITSLQQQNAAIEKELRLLKQDNLILRNLDQGLDFITPKE